MVMCFAPACKHYSDKQICRFFKFPTDPKTRKVWISLVRRKDREPNSNSLICSCHFVNGDKNNGPTLFENRPSKLEAVDLGMKRKRKTEWRQKPADISSSSEDISRPGSNLSNIAQSEFSSRSSTGTSSALASEVADVDLNVLERPSTSDTSQKRPKPKSLELEIENYFLKQEVESLTKQMSRLTSSFSFEQIKNSDERVLLYTGMPTSNIFKNLFNFMDKFTLKYYNNWVPGKISKMDQLLMTLMKLRLNVPFEDLACRFNCSRTTVSNIFMTWLCALHEILFLQLMAKIPSRQKNQTCLPNCFSLFTNCRVILDCTEFTSVVPFNLEKQKATYSNYKHRNTMKGLVGVAPNGAITYLSDLYPGSTSDKLIVKDCGVLQHMVPGDLILADKGFLIKDLLPEGVHLNIPPFLTTAQFTPQQIIQTRNIAKARIHVERAIRRLKCYNIINDVPSKLLPYATEIFRVCGALTNFQFPLIKEVEDMYVD